MIRWLFFDLDGTLADSISVMCRVYMEFCRKNGIKGTKKEFQKLNGLSLAEIVSLLKKRHGLTQSERVLLASYENEIARSYRDDVVPMEGANHILGELNRKEYKLLLTTSAKNVIASGFIKRQKWEKYFQGYVFGNEIRKGKPDPEIYALALKKSNACQRDVFVVEDSPNGVRSAREAGLTVVGFGKDHNSARELLKNGAGTVISKLVDILNLVSNDDSLNGRYKIIATGNIKLKSVPDPIIERKCFKKREIVDKIWLENVCLKKKLFNGTIFNVTDIVEGREGIEVRGSFIEYKYYFAQGVRPGLNMGIKSVGVSGVVVFEEEGRQYLVFARRAAWTTHYPGFFELVPSGSIDSKCSTKGGAINHKAQLLSEFKEESGLPISCVKAVTDIAIILDTRQHVYDVCCKIVINACKDAIKERFLPKGEYISLKLLPVDKLNGFVRKYGRSMVPTSKALTELFLKTNNQTPDFA